MNDVRLSPRRRPIVEELLLPDGTRTVYEIRRLRQARRITLRVTDNVLVVSAPVEARAHEIRSAVARRGDWVATALAEARALAPAPLGFGDRIPLLGDSVVIVSGVGRSPTRAGDRLTVPAGASVDAAVEAWYRRTARAHFAAVMDAWSPRIGVRPARLTVRAQRSRWGSASAAGTISLNWRLVMTPPEVCEYVIVHELVHLRHMNHSPEFWACVEAHWPSHRTERAWLRRHGRRVMAGPHARDPEC
jgi:predicted metal-dependent hydrolase